MNLGELSAPASSTLTVHAVGVTSSAWATCPPPLIRRHPRQHAPLIPFPHPRHCAPPPIRRHPRRGVSPPPPIRRYPRRPYSLTPICRRGVTDLRRHRTLRHALCAAAHSLHPILGHGHVPCLVLHPCNCSEFYWALSQGCLWPCKSEMRVSRPFSSCNRGAGGVASLFDRAAACRCQRLSGMRVSHGVCRLVPGPMLDCIATFRVTERNRH